MSGESKIGMAFYQGIQDRILVFDQVECIQNTYFKEKWVLFFAFYINENTIGCNK